MKATYDKPWVLVGMLDSHVWARAASPREILLHKNRMGWTRVYVEQHLRAGR